MMRPFAAVLAALLPLAACASDTEPDDAEAVAPADGDTAGKADADTELRVRASDTTLWISHDVTRHGDTFTLHGHTSRNLTGGLGFVVDDPYGAFATTAPRSFDLTWGASEIRALADGIDQLIGLDFVHANGRPDHLAARVVVRPRLSAFTGSAKIYLTAELTPVIVGGTVVYRISGHSTGANTGVRAVIGGVDLPGVTRADDTRFAIDLSPDQAIALTAAGGGDLQVIVAFPTGGVDKHASLGLAVQKLGLTSADAEEHWPRPTCTPTVRACLTALPDGTLDLGSCGEARDVQACAGQVGVFVDDVAVQASLHDANARLATAAARADAVSLAGADRADAFLAGEAQTVEARLQDLYGRWYASATARATALAAGVDAGLDAASARPLDVIARHPPSGSDAAAEHQYVADAVLAELARMDFVHTDFARTLDSLVHEFHARHVADIGAFRTTIAAETDAANPAWDDYVASWLGLHTEVVVDRTTGVVVRTLVEID